MCFCVKPLFNFEIGLLFAHVEQCLNKGPKDTDSIMYNVVRYNKNELLSARVCQHQVPHPHPHPQYHYQHRHRHRHRHRIININTSMNISMNSTNINSNNNSNNRVVVVSAF